MIELQEKVKQFTEKHGIHAKPEFTALDLLSELGEVAKEILNSSSYGKEPTQYTDELKTEMGDMFFSFICLANHYRIDLGEALESALDKYKKRLKKGSIGSEDN